MDKDIWVGILDAVRLKVYSNKQYVAGEVVPVINSLESPLIPPDLPNDGATRIGYSLPDTAPNKTCRLHYCGETAGTTVVFDWGDGTTTTSTGSGYKTVTHTHTSGGNYTLVIKVTAGSIYFGGGTTHTLWGTYNDNTYLRPRFKWVVFGNVGFDSYALYTAYGLETVKLPAGITIIKTWALSNCITLREIDVPATVTALYSAAFAAGYNLKRIRFNSATPPTVDNEIVFNSLPADCVISVPTGKLSAYTSAANYPNSDNYTYVEED